MTSKLHRLNFRNVHRGRGIEEEASMNQRDLKSSGVLSGSGSRNQRIDTSRSVQFGVVDTESKVSVHKALPVNALLTNVSRMQAAAMTIGLNTIQSGTGLDDDEASGQLNIAVLLD